MVRNGIRHGCPLAIAIQRVKDATMVLEAMGVRLRVTGSLAKGAFGPASDVDFVVIECPRRLKYAIEATVEDHLLDIPFDVVYLDEIPSWKLAGFVDPSVHASDLR